MSLPIHWIWEIPVSSLRDRMQEHLALGHSGGAVVENWDIPTLAGAGAIRSSAADMARFIAANMGYIDSELAAAMELSHKVPASQGW